MAKTGRPTIFSDALADTIVEKITDGLSLRTICDDAAMPNRSTVVRWLADDESFATKYARAREMQADFMDALVLDTADKCTSETAAADRVKIAAYQWRAAKLRPKAYGDRLDLTTGGEKLGIVDETGTAVRAAALLTQALGRDESD